MSPGRVKKNGVGEEFFLLKLWKNWTPHAGKEVFLVDTVACSFEQWRDAGDDRRQNQQLDDGEVVYGRMRDNTIELFLVYLQDGRLGYNKALQSILEGQGKVVTMFDHQSYRRSGRVITEFQGHRHEGRSLSTSPNERRPRKISFQPLASPPRSSSTSLRTEFSNRRKLGRQQVEPYIAREVILEMGRELDNIVLPPLHDRFLFGKHDLGNHPFYSTPPPDLLNLYHGNQQKIDSRIAHSLPAKPPPPLEWNDQMWTAYQHSSRSSSRTVTPSNRQSSMDPTQLDLDDNHNLFVKHSKTNLELSLDAVSRSVNAWVRGRTERNVKVGCTDFAYFADSQGKPPPGQLRMLLIVVVAEKDFPTHRDDRYFTASGVNYPRIGYIENGEPRWTCSETLWSQFFVYGSYDRNRGAGPEVMAFLQNSKIDDYTIPGPRPNILDDLALEAQQAKQKAANTEKHRLKKLAAREKARAKKAEKENAKSAQKKEGNEKTA